MIQEQLKQALKAINEMYITGCIEYYSKQDPDLWQIECDVLESIAKIGSEVEVKDAIRVFEVNCKKLIVEFQK